MQEEKNTLVEEPQTDKGKLKIFLGYCAGVGKTYRMLQEAIVSKKNNTDVVVGIVETHGRVETQGLVKEFEVMPRKMFEYGGIKLGELDLDNVLSRKPELVLVDELAHTNLPGSRHTKRYQDVEELLNSGINVFTTLNIQHVQSLTDIIYQITTVKVEEIIPDRILELANEIELVDLPPEKLQQRLTEGKVYIPQKAKQAMQKFFKKGNLLALRELSLKYTAKRVDIDLLSYREREEILNVWPIEAKILVGIGSSKVTEKVLLIAHRMATDLEADWYAVHVESSQQVKTSEKARNQLYRNIHLAEELGAKVVTLSGNSIADEILGFARQKNVTLIITGLQ
ncbi:MAG: sensor histidine kinase KdpD [Gammaproteobacteria bacterium]|nr:sensor histidine kinase KdpD [Gammaproteobacteria bacterium]